MCRRGRGMLHSTGTERPGIHCLPDSARDRGLVIVPMLNLMATNMRADSIYEERRDQTYACDAGIEHALHRIVNNLPPVPSMPESGNQSIYNYTLPAVNEYPVNVTIQKTPLSMTCWLG